jgi:photosystem II stability/assembly factor-like uncharacterized protein
MLLLLAVVFTSHFPLTRADATIIPGRVHANVVYALSNHVLYRSDDGGATFARRSSFATDVTLTVDPADDDVVYALSREPSLQRSSDGGAHWSGRVLPRYVKPLALLIDPRNPSTIVLAGDCSGVWISKDGGESWSQQSPACVQRIALDPDNGKLYVNDVTGIVVDPHAPLVRYAISNWFGVVASYDGGATWQRFGLDGMNGTPTSLAIDPISGRLFAGAGAGVFISDNGVPFWRRAAGTPPFTSDVAVAGTTLFITTWNAAYRAPLPAMAPLTRLGALPGVPADVRAIAADPHRPVLYASALVFDPTNDFSGATLWRSADRGEHWESIVGVPLTAPLTVDANGDVYGPGFHYDPATRSSESWTSALPAPSQLLADPRRRALLYAVNGERLYESPDGGRAWHNLVIKGNVYAIAVSGTLLYAGTSEGLFVTADSGAAWTLVARGPFLAIGVAPSRPSTLYVDNAYHLGARTDDGGATWHQILKPTERKLDAIVVDPRDDRSVWFVAKDGTFHSGDGGATWDRVGFLTTLVFDADGTSLHAVFASYSDMPGEWDAVLRAERRRPARK